MAITEAAERLALYKIIDYLDEDPAEHIEKIMGLLIPRSRVRTPDGPP